MGRGGSGKGRGQVGGVFNGGYFGVEVRVVRFVIRIEGTVSDKSIVLA